MCANKEIILRKFKNQTIRIHKARVRYKTTAQKVELNEFLSWRKIFKSIELQK